MEAAALDSGLGRGGAGPAAPGTLTVLGCDGSYPGPGGAASGYLVEAGETRLWLDAGPGTFARLQLVANPAALDALVISHEHPDHWTDLESFAVWLRHTGDGRPFPVYAAPGIRQRAYFGGIRLLEWHETGPGAQVTIGRLLLTFDRTDHGPPTMAVRLDRAGVDDPARALVYSGDTGAAWSVESLGRGIGTFLCEATYTREQEGRFRHLSARQAGTMAAEAGAARLVVTHRWPGVPCDALAAEADDAFGKPVHQAAPGRVFEW